MFKKIFALFLSGMMAVMVFGSSILANEPDKGNSATLAANALLEVNGISMVKKGSIQPSATNGTVKGATYNGQTNTLTLNNYQGIGINTDYMGTDFKIVAEGTNTINGTSNSTGAGIYIGNGDVAISGDGTTYVNGVQGKLTNITGFFANNINFTSGQMYVTVKGVANKSVIGVKAGNMESKDVVVSGGLLSIKCNDVANVEESIGLVAGNLKVSGAGVLKAHSASLQKGDSSSIGIACVGSINLLDSAFVEAIGGNSGTELMGDSIGLLLSEKMMLNAHATLIAKGGYALKSKGIYSVGEVELKALEQQGQLPSSEVAKVVQDGLYYQSGILITQADKRSKSALATSSKVRVVDSNLDFSWRDKANGLFVKNSLKPYSASELGSYSEIRSYYSVNFENNNNGLSLLNDDILIGEDYRYQLTTISDDYTLPETIKVSVNGKELTEGYTYNPATGVLIIDSDYIDGNIVISATAVAKNSNKKEVTPSNTPATGDNSNLMLWLLLMAGSAILLERKGQFNKRK